MIDAGFRKVCLDKQVNKMAMQVAEGACARRGCPFVRVWLSLTQDLQISAAVAAVAAAAA